MSYPSDAAVKAKKDTLSTSGEVQKAIITAFEKHAGLFVPDGEDEPLPCELWTSDEVLVA